MSSSLVIGQCSYCMAINTHEANCSKAVVSEEWGDSDGHWILLSPGYQIDDTHAIHEATRAEALARLRDVKECQCHDCKKP